MSGVPGNLPAMEDLGLRRVIGLALPALVVLAAEPLYILVDTAVVGHLGRLPLSGLAVGGVLLAAMSTQLTFLAYGTTARASRLFGAGRRAEAVGEGVQATWVALGIGVIITLIAELLLGPLTRLLAGPGETAVAAAQWLRIALPGVPLILITMAGNGWMRGVQDTRRPLLYTIAGTGLSAVLNPILVYGLGWGLEGSAVANVLAQLVAAGLFLRALLAEGVALRPQWSIMRAQLVMGRDLVLRTAGFQACMLSVSAVAARFGAAAVGGGYVVNQLWFTLALIMDAVAIAAQSLVGAELGAGRADTARGFARRISGYGLLLGCGFAVLFAALYDVAPRLFTQDAAAIDAAQSIWWLFVAALPFAGVVFALDGVLLGAGDAAFLRNLTLFGGLVVFLPMIWASLAFGWGLPGIWAGQGLFILTRLVGCGWRTWSGRWAVVGAPGQAVGA
ncbi:MATE family efflux transporter [Pseudonocardiaceae bacterium YIM PH 21723]|nr:MATE family efflux transporter [Pseudonocardiaceae bacterium YIM PH 21723]